MIMAIEAVVGLQAPQYLWFSIIVGAVYLLWTWDVLAGFVATHQNEDRTLSLGDLTPSAGSRQISSQASHPAGPAIDVEWYGGNDATLIIRNNGAAARFTAEGQLLPNRSQASITRQRPFRLNWLPQKPTLSKWTDFDTIDSGHFGTIVLMHASYATDDSSAHVAVLGDGGGVEAWQRYKRKQHWRSFQNVTPLQIRVVIRAQPELPEEWSKVFEMWWDGKARRFHIAVATPPATTGQLA